MQRCFAAEQKTAGNTFLIYYFIYLICVFVFFFPVKVTMKGSQGFISITEWPLMIVSRWLFVTYVRNNSKIYEKHLLIRIVYQLLFSDLNYFITAAGEAPMIYKCLSTNPTLSVFSSTWWCA